MFFGFSSSITSYVCVLSAVRGFVFIIVVCCVGIFLYWCVSSGLYLNEFFLLFIRSCVLICFPVPVISSSFSSFCMTSSFLKGGMLTIAFTLYIPLLVCWSCENSCAFRSLYAPCFDTSSSATVDKYFLLTK